MANDLLSQILRNRNQNSVMAPDVSDDDFVSQLATQAPPLPTEAQLAAEQKLKRVLALGPGDNAGDPTRAQLSPSDVYNQALDEAKGTAIQKEEAQKAQALSEILRQRQAMKAQGAPEESLPKLPDNKGEAARLQAKLDASKPKVDEPDEAAEGRSKSKDDTEDTGMAESLPSRHGEEGPSNERFLNALDKADEMESKRSPAAMPPAPQAAAPIPYDYMNALINAQQQAGNMEGIKMLAQAGQRIGAGISRTAVDPNFLKDMNTQQPVMDVMNQQKMAALGLEQQARQRDLDLKKKMDDPNSNVSDVARQILAKGAPSLKTDGMSATQMSELIPGLKTVLESELNREMKKTIQEEKTAANKEKTADKKEAEFTKHDVNFNRQIQSVRGQKDVINQSETIRRVNNALSVMDNPIYKGNYDKIPQNVANVITKDLATIVQGGVGSDAGFKELSNPTAYGKLSTVFSALGNEPTGAKLGKFIQQNRSLLTDLRDNATKALKSRFEYNANTIGQYLKPDALKRERDSYYNDILHITPEGAPSNIPPGQVKIRRKSDGAVKTLSAQDATPYLNSPEFEVVK